MLNSRRPPIPSATKAVVSRVSMSLFSGVYLPAAWLEFWFLALVAYSTMGNLLPETGVPLGAMGTLLLAAVCAVRMGSTWRYLMLRVLWLPFACGLSFIAIQVLVHDLSIADSEFLQRSILWMVGLVIVHYLALRPGFTHRAAIFVVALGFAGLPYLQSFSGDLSRMALDRRLGPISNPNDLAAWFGFCCVYVVVVGLEVRRTWIRVLAALAAIICVFVVGLTVSRGPLFAAACSLVFAFRRLLRRGFAPLVILLFVAWFAYVLGFFDRATDLYERRAFVESGRFLVWPLAIRRFLESPLAGVGMHNIATLLPLRGVIVTPHNGFLFMALSSGIVPFCFFTAFWIYLLMRTGASGASSADAPFKRPLLVYALLISCNLNESFTSVWTLIAMAFVGKDVLTSGASILVDRTAHRQLVRRDVSSLQPLVRL